MDHDYHCERSGESFLTVTYGVGSVPEVQGLRGQGLKLSARHLGKGATPQSFGCHAFNQPLLQKRDPLRALFHLKGPCESQSFSKSVD